MAGHGWVTPRTDGSRARCGGPVICAECATEQAQAKAARSGHLTVYASIGNSDDKLPQRRWHEYWVTFRRQVLNYADRVHGEWLSIGCAPYQNGCICFDLPELAAASLKAELRKVAGEFGQDSIAWAEAVTEFLGPGRTA